MCEEKIRPGDREHEIVKANFSNLRKSSKIFEAKGKRLSSPNTVSTFIRCLFKEGGKKGEAWKEEAGVGRCVHDRCGWRRVVDSRAWKKGRRGGEEERWIAREARRFV